MQQFVNNRVGSPSRPQSANSKRLAAAANAKAVPPKTSLQPERPQQHAAGHFQHAKNANRADLVTRGQRRDSDETIGGKNDLYGTDAGSSIDTTIHSQPANTAEQVRRVRPLQDDQTSGHEEQEESYSEYEDQSTDDGEDDGARQEYGEGEQNAQMGYNTSFVPQQHLPQQGFFTEGNSYPSTTSGLPDDLSHYDPIEQQRPVYPTPNEHHREPAMKHTSQSLGAARPTQPPTAQRANAQPAVTSNMAVPTFFEKGTMIRETEQRVQKDLNRRGKVAYQPNAANDAPSHPHGPNTAAPQTARAGASTLNQQSFASGTHIPQPSANMTGYLPSKPVRASPGPSTLVTRSSQIQPQIQFQEEPIVRHRHVEEEIPPDVESPVEDYDTPALFELSYEQLQKEEFDHEPRGTNRVVSDDMQQRPLPERLVHIQKNFNPGDQHQFFRALPTREWEDAGDWFLDQFSKIINQARDARQNKRKLAREFEDEVEKRYRHVEKRQQNVETALEDMKAKGQGLIPKSPRASRQPSVKPPRSQKR